MWVCRETEGSQRGKQISDSVGGLSPYLADCVDIDRCPFATDGGWPLTNPAALTMIIHYYFFL